MIGDESEGGVVTVIRLYAQDEVNQEDSEQNEVDGMKKGADKCRFNNNKKAVRSQR